MAGWYAGYWANIKAVIHATWPEVPSDQIFQDTRLERSDWINILNAGQLTGAWVVVKIDVTDAPDDWPPDWPSYQPVAAIHYIAATNTPSTIEGAPTPPLTITEYLAKKQNDLIRAFYAAVSAGTVLTSAPISLNADDPITAVLLDAKLPFQSASVQVTSIVTDIGQ